MRALATLLFLHTGAALLEAQAPLTPEMEALLERLLELRTEESQLLETLTDSERDDVLEALTRRLSASEAADPKASPRPEPATPAASRPPTGSPPTVEAPELPPPRTPAAPTIPDIGAAGLPPRCNTLLPFDSNEDGRFSGADRHYRNFRLWLDTNGNGTDEEGELESLLPAGVRSLDLDLRSYVSTRKDSATGEVFVSDTIEIELFAKRGRPQVHLLGIDTDALASDGFHLEDDQGEGLTGTVLLRPGLVLLTGDGERIELSCP